jgi:hypothetical protein
MIVTIKRSKLSARVLIVLTLLGTSGSWHPIGDDPEFQSQVIAHDHSSHGNRFWTPAAAKDPSHCAICHWLQSFRSDSVRHTRVQFVDTAYRRVPTAGIGLVRAIDLLNIPPRAPPA